MRLNLIVIFHILLENGIIDAVVRKKRVIADTFQIACLLVSVFPVAYDALHYLHVGDDLHHLLLGKKHSRGGFFLLAATAGEKKQYQ